MYKTKTCIFFNEIYLGLRNFSDPYAQILPPVEIGKEAVLDVWIFLEHW